MVHTKEYGPGSTPKNMGRAKREGSDDEFEMTALYVYVAGLHTKEYMPVRNGGSGADIALTGIYSLVWTML